MAVSPPPPPQSTGRSIRFNTPEEALDTTRWLRRLGRRDEARAILSALHQRAQENEYGAIFAAAVRNGLTRLDIEAARRKVGLVWLLSYPRTGSTWLRFLITAMIQGTFDQSKEANKVTPTLEYGITLDQIAKERPTFVKTHYAYARFLVEATDLADLSIGAIYVARHPADVAMSVCNYLNRQEPNPDQDREETEQNFLNNFLKNGGAIRFLNLGYGTYVSHFTGWRYQPLIRRLQIIRYEDLISQPQDVLRAISDTWKLGVDDKAIEAAIESCAFERMREMEVKERDSSIKAEEAEKVAYTFAKASAFPPPQAMGLKENLYFVNRGESGYGLESLSDEQKQVMNKTFGRLMAELGYAEEEPA